MHVRVGVVSNPARTQRTAQSSTRDAITPCSTRRRRGGTRACMYASNNPHARNPRSRLHCNGPELVQVIIRAILIDAVQCRIFSLCWRAVAACAHCIPWSAMIATLYPGRHRAPRSTSDVGHCRGRAELGCPHAQLRTHTAGLVVSPLVEESLQLRLLLLLPLAAAAEHLLLACHHAANTAEPTQSLQLAAANQLAVANQAFFPMRRTCASTGAIQSSRKGGVMCFFFSFCVRRWCRVLQYR